MVTIPVIDVCQVSVQPPARSVPVNCPAVTRVVTAAAGDADLQVTVKCTLTLAPARSLTAGKKRNVYHVYHAPGTMESAERKPITGFGDGAPNGVQVLSPRSCSEERSPIKLNISYMGMINKTRCYIEQRYYLFLLAL